MLDVIRVSGQRKSNKLLSGSDWHLGSGKSLQFAVKAKTISLGEYCLGKILRGVVTGLNEAFVIDGSIRGTLLRDCAKAKSLIKRFVIGRDLGKWDISPEDRWLIYMYHGVETDALAPILFT